MGHSNLHSSTKMKAAFILLATVANIAAGAGTYETELLRGIDIYNHRSKCWGKKNVDMYAAQMEKAKRECMQMEPMFDFPGHGEGVQNPFLRPNNRPFRHNAMGNLTCVLHKCGQLTEDMEVNMDFYTTALRAEEPETGFTWDVEGSAAKDPEWREKIATAYEDCHDLAESWPATSLNRRPMTRMFGRQMIFFKCADRTERRVCTEAQLLENLETFYGSESDEETAERIAAIGLPEDKYDAAAISIAVIQNAQSEEEKFVERFMWNLNGDSSM